MVCHIKVLPGFSQVFFFFFLHCRTSARHCRSTTGMSEERNQMPGFSQVQRITLLASLVVGEQVKMQKTGCLPKQKTVKYKKFDCNVKSGVLGLA